jgi:non-specific protein-tyrosine kinase
MYEVVLIDTAALLPVTDAAVLAPRVDGVLVLARHGHTDVHDLQAARAALDAVSGRVLGSVMTMVPRLGRRTRVSRRSRKDARPLEPFGPRQARGTGSAAPGTAAPESTAPGPAAPGPAQPQPAARRPSPEPRPQEPSDGGKQVLGRGPAAR